MENKLIGKELFQRTLTGLIFGSLFISALIKGYYYYYLILFTISLVMLIEILNIFKKIQINSELNSENLKTLKLKKYCVLTLFLMLLSLIYLRQVAHHGLYVSIWFFSIIWTFDTIAYIGGKKYGFRKLSSEISPHKTVEGFLLGLIGSIFVSMFFYFLKIKIPGHLSFNNFILMTILILLIAQFGDLFESYLKRKANIKNSGFLLPGHGGMFDRFDSIFFAAVFLAIIVFWNKNSIL